MPNFLVYIDNDAPYQVTAKSRCDATLDAMDKHRAARRITVKPVDVAPIRINRAMRRAQERDDAERIREKGKS